MLKLCQLWGCDKSVFLSITVFHDVQAQPRNTVMLKKNELFQALKRTKHCNAQKIPEFYAMCPWPGHRCLSITVFCEYQGWKF